MCVCVYVCVCVCVCVRVCIVDLSGDNQLLLTGSFDHSVGIVDTRYGQLLARHTQHHNKVTEVCCVCMCVYVRICSYVYSHDHSFTV